MRFVGHATEAGQMASEDKFPTVRDVRDQLIQVLLRKQKNAN